ncbi:MAG: FAD binding domain-containing protein [Actinomycetota bacterium]
MKPSSFEYLAPARLDEALEMLARHSGEAKLLAGGQSLIPAMNFRLAAPAVLIDLNRIPGHDAVRSEDGRLVVEMLVRHSALEDQAVADPLARLMARMARLVGHLPIRVRGTFAGSIAHADPAAEWCMLAASLDATIVARSATGERTIPAADFFEGVFDTALGDDEIVTEVHLPLLEGWSTGFAEESRTAGDFATVATVAALRIENGDIADARLGAAGAGSAPVKLSSAVDALRGAAPSAESLARAGRAAAEEVEPVSDVLCSADYRRHLVEVLTVRSLEAALKDAPRGRLGGTAEQTGRLGGTAER